MRLPKPPSGRTSWLGNSRSYERRSIDPRSTIASRRRTVPAARAVAAGTAPVKKIHMWAPRPDWEISNAAGTALARAAFA
ncbi:hypothetical protein KIF24_27195 [Micromonospora sp. Llam7]|nr:hypothetical protein [Micromonospora tarapacensis]MBX7269339.1 hypothetical protein [Micromonospora tarapacensis]